MVEPAERPEPVVDRHHDDVLGRGEPAPVEEARVPERVAAAVDPDHHRQAPRAGRHARVGKGGRPDVQVEAVLGARGAPGRDVRDAAEGARELRAGRREREALPRPRPPRGGLGRPPAPLADRRRRVGDAEPGVAAVAPGGADHRARACFPYRRRVGRGLPAPAVAPGGAGEDEHEDGEARATDRHGPSGGGRGWGSAARKSRGSLVRGARTGAGRVATGPRGSRDQRLPSESSRKAPLGDAPVTVRVKLPEAPL